jgi:hypothetical protein
LRPCGKHCPRAERKVPKNKFFNPQTLGFSLFFNFCFLHMILYDVILNMTAYIWHWSLGFINFFDVPQYWSFDQDPLPLKQFLLTHTCKSKDEGWVMFDQLGLDGTSKSAEEMVRASNCHGFFSWKNSLWKKIKKSNFHVWMS